MYYLKQIIKKHLYTLLKQIENYFFPQYCLICKQKNTPLCTKCFNKLAKTTTVKLDYYSIFSYKNKDVRFLLHEFKFHNIKYLAKPFAQALKDSMLEILEEEKLLYNSKDPLLVSIPMAKKKLKKRGYNQSDLLCKELEKITNLKYKKDILFKNKNTDPQSSIKNRNQRMKNIIGCFVINPNINICGRNIILVDDIITTGVTILEAKKILKKAGAKKIIAFTVAH